MANKTQPPLKQSLFNLIQQHLGDSLPVMRCTKSTLVHLSHTLENIILNNKIPAMLFTGFQESSHWQEETKRYHELAKVAQQVCIFAGKPLPIESGVNELTIELAQNDQLLQEWFLLVLSDEFSVLLCGQDKGISVTSESEREFDTIWTFNKDHIEHTLDILEDVIRHYRPEKLKKIKQARQTYTIQHPNSNLISQFVMNILQYETHLNVELRQQNTMMNTIIKAIKIHAFIVTINTLTNEIAFDYQTENQKSLFGYQPNRQGNLIEWIDQKVHPNDRDAVKKIYKNLSPYQYYTYENQYLHGNGHYMWLRTTINGVPIETDKIRVYGITQDITYIHEIEQIQHENIRLSKALEHEKELSAIRNYFISSVMHEFRNPLASVLLASEMLEKYEDKMTEDEKKKRLATIQTQVINLRDTLDDMTLIMSNQLSNMGFHPKAVEASIYFNEQIDHFRRGKGAHHRVIVKNDLSRQEVLLDTHLLKYAISALLANAAEYSALNSTITCRLFVENKELFFSVEDEGIGILPEDYQNIFKPLFRGENVSPTQHSGGLGLTIADECIKLHQGKIEFESILGKGSVFKLIIDYLPVPT